LLPSTANEPIYTPYTDDPEAQQEPSILLLQQRHMMDGKSVTPVQKLYDQIIPLSKTKTSTLSNCLAVSADNVIFPFKLTPSSMSIQDCLKISILNSIIPEAGYLELEDDWIELLEGSKGTVRVYFHINNIFLMNWP
jgi:hypothetical protein